MKNIFKLFLLLVAISGLFYSAPAHAIFISGSASPSSLTVPANIPATRAVMWTVNRAGGGGNTTVTSGQFDILLNGAPLHTVQKTLSKTINVILNITPFVFSETVSIPRAVMAKAIQSGGTLTLRRTFSEVNTANTFVVEIPIQLGTMSAADFSISRIELSFNNGGNSCAGQTGQPLRAIARLETVGSGLLRGEWQIRKGGHLGSFQTLRPMQVAVSAGMYPRVESPELPFDKSSRYDVRLVITSPTISFTEPVITCAVSSAPQGFNNKPDKSRHAEMVTPTTKIPLSDATMIRWKKVESAKAYRIDILESEDGEPVASQLVKKGEAESKPSALTLDKLDPKERYYIRVIAE